MVSPNQQHQRTEEYGEEFKSMLGYTVWVKNHWHFFPNGWKFLVKILQIYYTFLSMLYYKFLFNYLQLWRSYAVLSATTKRVAADGGHFENMM